MRWWWPKGAYWPTDAPKEETIAAFVAAFQILGYQDCTDPNFEHGYEKIALYAKDGKPTHAARQLSNGMWSSKLGKYKDISHIMRRWCINKLRGISPLTPV
ncbi:MAG TPA: hypothetical protein PKA53_10935, partial [Sphingobacterium sp.]|nr:hypothetical protein [Sphingobacterium sp.]